MRILSLLRPPFFFGGLAGVLGLGAALARLRAQGYLALGFDHNLAVAIRDVLLAWIPAGAAVGVAYAALAAATRIGARALAERGLPARAGVLATLGLVAALALLAVRPGDDMQRWGVLLAMSLWAGVLLAHGATSRGSLLRRGLAFAGLAIPLLVAVLCWLPSYHVVAVLRQREVLVALALVASAVVWVLAGSRGSEDALEDPLRASRPWPEIALWLPILAVSVWSATLGPRLEAGNPRNVLLIAVDTLRLDHTSLAGGDLGSARTPRLAAWAARGTSFTTAISQAPWTMPAFASILTSRYPRQHGAVSLLGRLRDGETTLAEVLREAGYWTGGVVSHVFVDADHGFGQGFDHYDVENLRGGEHAITSQSVSDKAIALLEEQGERPFFLFLHYFDPHYEFRDHPDRNDADGYRGWLRSVHDIGDLRTLRHRFDGDDVAYLRDLYGEEIAYTDAQIGRVLDRLDALGLRDDTVVVLVADHGEEFMERGWLGHTIQLHDELLRVPLVVALPDGDHVAVVEEPVETRAVAATLLDYLDVGDAPIDRGDSLVPLIRGRRGDPRAVFSEVWLPDAPEGSGKRVRISSVRSGRWKLIRDHDRELTSLYDLVSDPGELRDASAEAPDARDRLDALLERFLATMGGEETTPTRELDPELREQLRALGYVDG